MSAIKHSPGPWQVDTIDNSGEYSLGGDESACGFKSHAVYDANGRVLFDSLNSDVAEIHEESDEDGRYAWDGQSECNLRLAASAPELFQALREIVRCPSAFIGDGQVRITIDSSAYKMAIDSLAKATGAKS